MVQEYQSPVRVYKYPFDLVMVAYERRFPRCPQIPVVLDCIVTEDSWSADDSQRHTTRRCQLNVEAPYLLKKIIGVDYVYFIQKNHLDRKAKFLHIEATNETFSSRVAVVEKCRYFMHPENPEWTCFDQSATLDVKNFFGFENSIEKIAMKQYSSNISKGKEIIDYFVTEIRVEGIDSVQPWTEGAPAENSLARSLICRGAAPVGSPAARDEAPLEDKAACNGAAPAVATQQQGEYQLDSEYIQRYLGELTVMQESRLVQLKKLISELQKGKVPNDATLLRFLRARDFNVEKAREMLSQSLVWRKRHQVDRILSEYEMPHVVKEYFPGGWHHHDGDGRPLYILRLGQMDVKGLLKSIGEDGLLKLTLHVCEEGLTKLQAASAVSGAAVGAWTLLVDLEGLNMRHLWRPGVRALLRIIQIVEANYPDTMARVLVVRAPRVFPILWTIVSTFIDDNTRTKFLFYGGKDYLQPSGGLCDYIPDDVVPDFLGGPCKSFVHEGGLVPKNLYSSNVFTERSENDPLNEDSIYKFISIGKGQVMEIVVRNADPCSVLTWDFDVVRHDLTFTVFRTPRPLHPHPHHDNPIGVAALCSISASDDEDDDDPVQSSSADPSGLPSATSSVDAGSASTRSVLDRPGWRESLHYHRVEPAILCHNGESIQGSHVMTERASYILQWRWAGVGMGCEAPLPLVAPPAHSAPTADLLDSFTQHSHKAQLMYFYEVLTSHNYKGSVSSLQSSNSLQSGASATSSCPSR